MRVSPAKDNGFAEVTALVMNDGLVGILLYLKTSGDEPSESRKLGCVNLVESKRALESRIPVYVR